MRPNIQSARSPKIKPAQSQSPIQKKKMLKFVNQMTRADKSMQALPVFNISTQQSSSPVNFKKQIEERFQNSQTNYGYVFPRRCLSGASISSENSITSLDCTREYDLHTQNFLTKVPKQTKPEPVKAIKKPRDELPTDISSSYRIMTSTDALDNSRLNTWESKKARAQTPVHKSSNMLQQKPLMLTRDPMEKLNRGPKTPGQQENKSISREKRKRKEDGQSEKSLEAVAKRQKSSSRPQSSSKSSSRGNFKTVNLNLNLLQGKTNSGNNESGKASRNVIKINNLLEDENQHRTLTKSQATKSCKDLKVVKPQKGGNLHEAERYQSTVSTRAESQRSQLDKKPLEALKTSQLNNTSRFGALNKICQGITSKKVKDSQRELLMTEGDEFTGGEILQTEPAPILNPVIESIDVIYRTSMTRELFKQNNLSQKVQKDSMVKERSLEGLRSPQQISVKQIKTGPLTARNVNELKVDTKTLLKSVWSPRDHNAGVVASPKRKERVAGQRMQENIRVNATSLGKTSSIKQTFRDTQTSQNLKNIIASKQIAPSQLSLTIMKTEENERREDFFGLGTRTFKKVEKVSVPKTKQEKQLMFKRNGGAGGELSSRYQLDKSDAKVKSYYK